MNIRIEPLQIKDAHLIPKLIKSGMNKDIFPLTIFSSEGYVAYIKNLLAVPEKNRRVKLFGAFVDDRLAGYTEWRIFEEDLFLNNIYVFPEYQRSGIGKSLLVKHGYHLLDEYGKYKMSLDVFNHNEEAISWYEKIGFVRNDSTYWYVGGQLASARSHSTYECYIENYPNAEAQHDAYDFSMFTCSTREGVYQIGKIKNQFYRLTDSNALNDHDLLSCLLQLDPKRKILLLTGEVFYNHSEFTLACKSNRMNIEIS
ncbi:MULTISPECIES: GNAT family N-acetyltransferase [Bacillaceae]|uniref:GNAT family N-acetyltransferase n=1 Tax=Bacillaceae TaxID=186817 RepID=UPI000A2AB96A|nr:MULTISPECIES: GNAT family N-acetyltransferase [unclassified Bacillus (in: firmicutes)]PGY15150.1 N-acetyltransferase [Bacillus sp. AFS031507]SMQ83805.1 Acetyltransferase (GNAT) family protein [Bacillus sp. OV166]